MSKSSNNLLIQVVALREASYEKHRLQISAMVWYPTAQKTTEIGFFAFSLISNIASRIHCNDGAKKRATSDLQKWCIPSIRAIAIERRTYPASFNWPDRIPFEASLSRRPPNLMKWACSLFRKDSLVSLSNVFTMPLTSSSLEKSEP
jgi:hypothetical protein